MAVKGMFFNALESGGVYDRIYNASDFCTYLHNIVGNGVFAYPSTQLQVVPGGGMNITVSAGEGWIDGHKLINTQAYNITLDPSDVIYSRIDRVVFFCDYEGRRMGIKVKKGTEAVSPTAPDVTRNSSIYEMSLATIDITNGLQEITSAQITDTRPDTTVCGWVAGLIDQIDTSTLYDQYTAAYNDYFLAIEAQVQDFVDTLTQELKIKTYLAEYEWRGTLSTEGASVAFAPVGYSYDPSDVIFVYINGLLASEHNDFELSVSGTSLTVNFLYDNADQIPQDLEIRVLKTRMAIRIISAAGNGIVVDNNNNNLIGG